MVLYWISIEMNLANIYYDVFKCIWKYKTFFPNVTFFCYCCFVFLSFSFFFFIVNWKLNMATLTPFYFYLRPVWQAINLSAIISLKKKITINKRKLNDTSSSGFPREQHILTRFHIIYNPPVRTLSGRSVFIITECTQFHIYTHIYIYKGGCGLPSPYILLELKGKRKNFVFLALVCVSGISLRWVICLNLLLSLIFKIHLKFYLTIYFETLTSESPV